MPSETAHYALISLATLIVVLLTTTLGDGRSLMALKAGSLPIITDPTIATLDARFLFGQTYGIGLHHEQSGRSWNTGDAEVTTLKNSITLVGIPDTIATFTTYRSTDSNPATTGLVARNSIKHPATYLSCYGMRGAGSSAMALGFLADILAASMIVFHGAAMAGRVSGGTARAVSLVVWLLLSLGLLTVVVLAGCVYASTWECDQQIIPTLRLADSFDMMYGLPFAVVCNVAAIVALILAALGISGEEEEVYSTSASSTTNLFAGKADHKMKQDLKQELKEELKEELAEELKSELTTPAEVGESQSTELPLPSKLAHVLAVIVSGVIALAVAAVLADGKSVITLKHRSQLPIITNPVYRSQGFYYRADELLGQTYGIGLHHDQSGKDWTRIGAERTMSNLVENLGIPVVIAAVPRVVMTDGAPPAASAHPPPTLPPPAR